MAYTRDKIVTGIALIIVGVLFLAAPTTTTKVLYGSIGLVLAIAGLFRLIVGLRYTGSGFGKFLILVPAVILIILGIFLLTNPSFLIAYDYIIFGLIMILNGIFNIVGIFKGEIQGNKLFNLILSVLLVIAGFVVLAHPISAAEMLTMLIGVLLIVSGIINVLIALRITGK